MTKSGKTYARVGIFIYILLFTYYYMPDAIIYIIFIYGLINNLYTEYHEKSNISEEKCEQVFPGKCPPKWLTSIKLGQHL